MKSFPVINKTGEVWPAYGVAKLGDIDGDAFGVGDAIVVYKIAKPDGGDGIHIINGPSALPDGKGGSAKAIKDVTRVRVISSESPAKGDTVGPVDDEWFCSTSGDGSYCLGPKGDLDIVPVIWSPGGSTTIQASTDSCECRPVTNPDIEVNGRKATYEVTIPLSKSTEYQECGVLILKEATYTLVNTGTKSEPTTTWSYTVQPEDLSAIDYTGATKAFDTVGTITWEPFATPKAKLTVDVPIILE